MISLLGKTRQILKSADQARDSRHWTEAIRFYRQYLLTRPDDAAIWVQLGHALKESGAFLEAEEAYTRSFELAPEVADTALQLGHLYKIMHKSSNATTSYREALRLDGMLEDARLELENSGFLPNDSLAVQPTATIRKSATFLDLSDVFFYLRHHKTLSGIQRVQMGIATAVIAMAPAQRAGIVFLAEALDESGYVEIDDVFISELTKELSCDIVEHTRLINIMRSATNCGRVYAPVSGDTLLILGAFWVLDNIAERIIALKRQNVRVGTLIHDIIPITHPEFCVKSLTESFKSALFTILSVADFVLTVSDHSGRCVKDFLAKNHIKHGPIQTLRLAHRTWEPPTQVESLSPVVARLIKDDYVIYVSTIEVRKNHAYLFHIWKRLIEQFGTRTPKLVFIGRAGWRVNDLLEQLESTSNLNGQIKMLHDVTDMELAALYRSALFSVFPSVEEGWGLPVGESLIFGRPCIASNSSSIPEVGGDFVDYIDPFNERDGYEKILRFIENRDLLEGRAREIQHSFKPRDWTVVASDMIRLVGHSQVSKDFVREPLSGPQAMSGHRYRLGHDDDMSNFIASGNSAFVHLACTSGWGRVENFGRWMRGRTGALEFLVNEEADELILVMLEVVTVGWLGATQLEVTINATPYPLIRLQAGARRFVVLETKPQKGRIEIGLNGIGDILEGQDERKHLWLGLGSVAYADHSDLLSRLMLLEHMTYHTEQVIRLQPEIG